MIDADLAAHIQKLGLGSLVTLYEIDLSPWGEGTLFFTPMMDPIAEDGLVSFGGQVYTAFPIIADGFEFNGTASPPMPTVTVSNLNHAFTSYLAQYDNLIGAGFRRIRTFSLFLDSGEEPDGDAHYPVDEYRFDRKVRHNKVSIAWEMASVLDQQGVKLPRRIVVRDYCDQIYRRWDGADFDYSKATCPYAGSNKFTETDESTGSGALDRCGHTLASCKLRFGENEELPFRGFPGVAKFRT